MAAAVMNGPADRSSLSSALRAPGLAAWLSVPVAGGVYLLAKSGVAHPGWWAHFNFSFVAQQDTMAGFAPAFDVRTYLTALARVSVRLLRDEIWPWFVIAIAIWSILAIRLRELRPVVLGLLVFVAGVFTARMIAFPLPDARVATPTVIILLMVVGAIMSDHGARTATRSAA